MVLTKLVRPLENGFNVALDPAPRISIPRMTRGLARVLHEDERAGAHRGEGGYLTVAIANRLVTRYWRTILLYLIKEGVDTVAA